MLTETERQEIFDVVQDYRKAHLRLADHYKDKRAHAVAERTSRRAGHYLYAMKQSLYNAGQNLNDDDIKCFALLVDSFEQMQRNRLLGDLQKYANFDVVSFVGAYNRDVESKLHFAKKKEVTELSAKDLMRRADKINRARKNIKKHHRTFHNMEVCDVIRDEANELAHAVVNGKLKNNSKEYFESVRKFLDVAINNSVDGDIVDAADKILVEKIKEIETPMEIEDFVPVQDNVKELAPEVEQTATDRESVKEKIGRVRKEIEERKQEDSEKIHQWKQRIEQQKVERKQKNREIAQERAQRVDKKKAEREQALREKIEQVRAKIKQNAEKKRSEKLRKETEQAEQARLKDTERQARQERRQERVDNAKKAVSDAAGKVAGGFVSVKDKLKAKWQAKKSEIETNKRNREIIRDAERASKEHWNELKLKEKQAEEEKKNLGCLHSRLLHQLRRWWRLQVCGLCF